MKKFLSFISDFVTWINTPPETNYVTIKESDVSEIMYCIHEINVLNKLHPTTQDVYKIDDLVLRIKTLLKYCTVSK